MDSIHKHPEIVVEQEPSGPSSSLTDSNSSESADELFCDS